jgi:hypothetical protein
MKPSIKHLALAISLLCLASLLHDAQAQVTSPYPEEQPTNLEIFEARTGTVIIRGYTETARLQGGGGTIRITAQEMTDTRTRQKIYGLILEARDATSPERETRAYLDYEEIDPLLQALDQIIRTDRTITALANFEAAYRTPGGLEVTAFNGRQELQMGIFVGHYRRLGILFPLSRMTELRRLIAEAKAHLDATRQP